MSEPWEDDDWEDDLDAAERDYDYDDEDDDPYGCCCPDRCLMWDTHRMSECYTSEGCYEPTRWERFRWAARDWLRSLIPAPNHRCEDCGLPDRRLWFPVGQHGGCECLPF